MGPSSTLFGGQHLSYNLHLLRRIRAPIRSGIILGACCRRSGPIITGGTSVRRGRTSVIICRVVISGVVQFSFGVGIQGFDPW
jgi:hypothetical protein